MFYLDYNTTIPTLPELLEAMQPNFTQHWGNPSSTYEFGYKIKTALETMLASMKRAAELLSD